MYYRHAKGENLFVLGPESNHYKAVWVRRQVDMFSSLGWQFLVLDMSTTGQMGSPHLIGERWSNIERHFVLHTRPPVVVRIPRFRDMLEILDDINLMKFENGSQHTIVVHLGNIRTLTNDEKRALYGALLKIAAYNHGLWLLVEHFQTFPMENIDMFHTQVVCAQEEPDIGIPLWTRTFNIEECDVTQLDENEAYCLFRGRSEGARRLLIADLAKL